jgi:hypothetical protein
VLLDLAEGAPVGRAQDLAGPEESELVALARATVEHHPFSRRSPYRVISAVVVVATIMPHCVIAASVVALGTVTDLHTSGVMTQCPTGSSEP